MLVDGTTASLGKMHGERPKVSILSTHVPCAKVGENEYLRGETEDVGAERRGFDL